MLFSAVFGIVSAVVGAGFASGREIMHFFSRYGFLSWGLCALAAVVMGGMTKRMMGERGPSNPGPWAGKALFLLLYAASGGAMTAAAGELSALTVPLPQARILGEALTLCAAVLVSRHSVRALGAIGKILAPLMLLAFFFCARVPPEEEEAESAFSHPGLGISLIELLGYCGLNVTLAAGVVWEAGQGCPAEKQNTMAVWTAIVFGVLLLAGNAALLPHASALNGAALPVVALLRNYGKAGFYLSAAVLYLAVFSTLAAILRALRGLLPQRLKCKGAWAGLLCAASSLIGFEQIVGSAYPVLGWLGILLIFGKKLFKAGTNRRFPSSIGRIPNKEDADP